MDYALIHEDLSLQEQSTLVDKAEMDLLDFFREKQFQVGDVIPKEVELAVQLGVSRTVLREALLRLRMRGMVETKKKRGTVITNPDLLGLLEKTLFDTEQEIRFHGKLYDITGNPTLRRFQRMLLPVFKYVHESGILRKPVQHKKFVSHRGLVDVIQHGNPETFRNAMRNHFENHFQRLF